MVILRDLRESTRLLFLYEVTTQRHTRLRTIAERLGMTVQGASNYAHALEREDLLQVVGGEYRATKKGVERLHAQVRELREFVDRARRELTVINVASAVAATEIRAGEPVGLFMERGQLRAYAGRESPSRGIAVFEGSRGEDVAIAELQGIVELRPGRITIWRIPSARSGGTRRIRGPAPKGGPFDVVGYLDAVGQVAARRLGLRATAEFGVVPAAIEAAERGLRVLVLAPEDRVPEVVGAIEEANRRLEDPIPYETAAIR